MIELYHIIRFCDSVSSPDHFFGFAMENGDETMTESMGTTFQRLV